jgi:glutamate 5-kinase
MLDKHAVGKRSSHFLKNAKRIVIKVGSALLVDSEHCAVRQAWLSAFIEDVAAYKERGQDIIIVSSGSIAMGRHLLGLSGRTLRQDEAQATAACGQITLMQAYQQMLSMHHIQAAQLLLTLEDTETRQAYLNVRSSLFCLLELGALPIINENDVVASPLRRYGDNDRLAARVAAMVEADCLILLSDIDGLYTDDPSVNSQARLIEEIHAITPEIEAMGGESRSGLGRGGMRTKIEAARMALSSGAGMLIARGSIMHPLRSIEEGCSCSLFVPQLSPSAARKIWIAGSLDPRGLLYVDDGAHKALIEGRSLLPVGVRRVEGIFSRGEAVRVVSMSGGEIARGLVAYDSKEACLIMGKRSAEIPDLLGCYSKEEMIHRDNLALSGGR